MTGSKSTLSLCALTDAAPAAAIAFLETWRPHVDEIVVAVDELAHSDTAAVCQKYADRVIVVPAAGHFERYLGWLLAQCSGDWVLRMDDDELPTTTLIEMLPDLMASRHHTHYWLPCRWLYPRADSYLASGDWLRDIHVRLIRNIPGIWHSSGRLHSEVEVLGSNRIVEAPFLHLTTLIDDVSTRRAKVAAYARISPASFTTVDRTARYYLPEDADGVVTETLQPSDAARVEEFLEKARQPVSVSAAERPTPDVDRRMLDAWSDEVLGPEGALAAEVRIVHPVEPMVAGSEAHVQVEVRNLGEDVWPGGFKSWPLVRVGHRWQRADGTFLDLVPARTYFTERVFPGATTRLLVAVQAPAEPGPATLVIDVVNEFVRWLETPAVQVVEIRPTGSVIGPPLGGRAIQRPSGATSREVARLLVAPLVRRRPTGSSSRRRAFTDDLLLLHDVLAPTPFGARYRVWGGLLLGWARQGRVLEHDLFDADFALLDRDHDLFVRAAPRLIENGFEPLFRFVNNEGKTTEYSFTRRDAKFEFFLTTPFDGKLRYFVYSDLVDRAAPAMQATSEVPDQPLETFSFLRRKWYKQADHERELTSIYGDWRTPDPAWWYMADRAIIAREPWMQTDYRWSGDLKPLPNGLLP